MLFDTPETKEKVLTEFLEISSLEGWSDETLLRAVQNCGIDEKYTKIIFENGCLELADFYIELQNKKCSERVLSVENFQQKKIREKIRLFLHDRFEIEKNNKIALQRLVNFYLNPKNFASLNIGARPMFEGLKVCFKISDSIWKSINDQSSDFNFYTKRLTLAKIILRSFLVFLKDESQNLEKTKDFIDQQIEAVMSFEKKKAQFKKFSSEAKKKLEKVFVDENGSVRSPKEILKNLPFIRLKF